MTLASRLSAILNPPKREQLDQAERDSLKRTLQTPIQTRRNCKLCRAPERVTHVGAMRYSNISQHLGICADCLNHELQQLNRS